MVTRETIFNIVGYGGAFVSFVVMTIMMYSDPTMTSEDQLPILFFFGVLIFLFIALPNLAERKRHKGADSALLSRDFTTARKMYQTAMKLAGAGYPQIELSYKLALVEWAENNNPESMRLYFKDSLNMGEKFVSFATYDLLERLANKFNMRLNEKVYNVFREEEFEYLKYTLNPYNMKPRIHAYISSWVRIQPAPSFLMFDRSMDNLEAEWLTCNCKRNVDARMHIIPDNKLVIEVFEFFHDSEVTVRYWDESAAFSASELGILTNETILSLVRKAGTNTKICSELIQKDMMEVIKQTLKFAKGRRMINEIDSFLIHVKKIIPVYWLEKLKTGMLEAPGFKFRVHLWSNMLTVDHELQIDFTNIPKEHIPPDNILKSWIKVEPDKIQLKLPVI